MNRALVTVSLLLATAGCTPLNTPERCQTSADCPGTAICMTESCVAVPAEDGGTLDAGSPGARDAGPAAPDAGVLTDAGLIIDAGTLTDAGATVDAGRCVPTLEICNGLDDDCDGLIDDLAIVTALDGGAVDFDGGVALPNGMCTVGLGACSSTGMTSCGGGVLACSAMPVSPGLEVCNTLDDDCDGQVDEAGPGLCPATGQLCSAGNCTCPGSQSVCGGACVTLGGTCSVGVGACNRSGADVCSGGSVACNAQPGTPGMEVCNGADDDCDGQTDETGPGLCPIMRQVCSSATCACANGAAVLACLPDADDDGYADNATVTQSCPDPTRATRGFCPAGYVAQSASLGPDCNPSTAFAYREVFSRIDADGDGYCLGAATLDCVGAVALSGRRFAVECQATEDCNDTQSGLYRLASTAPDADNDSFCGGSASNECIGQNPSTGRRFAASCTNFTDCNDANASVNRLMALRVDSDGDRYCTSAPAVTQCVGSGVAPAGSQYEANCLGIDCKDSNAYATTVCTLQNAHVSTDATKYCDFSAPSQQTLSVGVFQACPAGFSFVSLFSTSQVVWSGGVTTAGTCALAGPQSITMACAFASTQTFSCRIQSSCVAN